MLLVLLSMCAHATAQGSCPWLTEGTAAALMGGEVTTSVHVSAGEGTCAFVRVNAGDPASASGGMHLEILVSHLPAKRCATGERLLGIGQDAVFCRTDTAEHHQQTIRGRVRTSYFVLDLTSKASMAGDKGLSRRSLEEAAEEVAGSLF